MKKIGTCVHLLSATKENPRNGEGAFLRLERSILFAYSRYAGGDNHDHAAAEIAAIESFDEGETWSGSRILFPREEGALNNMCVSLLHRRDGRIAVFYLVKYADGKIVKSRVAMRVSADGGRSWGGERTVIDIGDYLVLENDRLIRLREGALLLPLNLHHADEKGCETRGRALFFRSEDDGESWKSCAAPLDFPAESKAGLQETGVFECEDGTLRSFSRTSVGCQYLSDSTDGGRNWTMPVPSEIFTSPNSPMFLKTLCGKTVAVFNPVPWHLGMEDCPHTFGRTPLIAAVSDDEFKSMPRVFALEDDPDNGFCYTALFDGGSYFLAAYYTSENGSTPLTSCKLVKVLKKEFC